MRLAPAALRSKLSRHILSIAGALLLLAAPAIGHGQATQAGYGPMPSRVDLAGAFGYLKPFNSDINNIPYQSIVGGGVFSASYYFKPHLGLQIEGNYFPNASDDQNCFYTAQAGPIYRITRGRFIPFVHVLGGAAEVGGPAKQTCSTWGYGVTGGGGLDYVLPFFSNRIAVRPIQADMTYSHVDNPTPAVPNIALGGVGDLYAVRLSAGLVLRLGSVGAVTRNSPSLSCTADPGNPLAGDPVTITSSITDLRSDKDTQYLWDVSAGKISPHGPGAVVDTTGLAPGAYTVNGHLVRGARHVELANCTASFTIRVIQPPTLTCSADRAAINSGDPVNIAASAASPENRPLTYTYSSTGGVVIGNGPRATLTTIGATPGAITVTCKVADDQGQFASATASVVVATPAPPPTPRIAQAQALCSISFDRDRKRPNRVDNESKACLDDIALSMNRAVDAKLVIVGNHDPREANQSAAERAMNAAQYLTDEKGIDPSRLDLRLGSAGTRSVSNLLVPPGATVDIGTAASFDTSSVRRSGQPYGKPKSTGATTTTTRRHRRRPANPPPPM